MKIIKVRSYIRLEYSTFKNHKGIVTVNSLTPSWCQLNGKMQLGKLEVNTVVESGVDPALRFGRGGS